MITSSFLQSLSRRWPRASHFELDSIWCSPVIAPQAYVSQLWSCRTYTVWQLSSLLCIWGWWDKKRPVASWDTTDHIWGRRKENTDCAGFDLKYIFLCVWLLNDTHLWNQHWMPSEKGQFNLLMLLWNDRAWFDQHFYGTIELKKKWGILKICRLCRQAEEDEQWNGISVNVCGMSGIFIWDIVLKLNFSEEI